MKRRTGWKGRDGQLPPEWARHRARRHSVAAELRIMVWIGLILGLLAFQAVRWVAQLPQAGPAATVPAPPALPDGPRRSSGQAAAPARVIDGDTFDQGAVRIRIADIDTPELRGECDLERRLAARATARMRMLLDAGPFELRPNPDGRDEDRYGRKLRIVTRDGRSLGAMLVAEGLARPWTGQRQPWC
jgi:micrococcal nuclease